MTTTIDPIPQWYSGVKFRSTLEARWAVFFDAADIRWDYEPEGYVVGGRPYRPDFLLRDCATWVEVKGDPARLDLELLSDAALELPRPAAKHEAGPPLMILGQLPPPPVRGPAGDGGDWGFVSLASSYPAVEDLTLRHLDADGPGLTQVEFSYYGFGRYHKNHRPWWLDGIGPLPSDSDLAARFVLESRLCEIEFCNEVIVEAYTAARAHRFGRR